MKLSPRDAGAVSIGIEFTISVLVGGAAGYWADARLHTAPWLTLVGFAVGFAAGLRSLLRMDRRDRARSDASKRDDDDGTASGG